MKRYCFFLLAMTLFLTYSGTAQQFDSEFLPFITRPGDVQKIRLLPDGRFLAAGDFTLANGTSSSAVARFLPDGTADPDFQTGLDFSVIAMDVQADGKVLIGGRYTGPGAPEGLAVLRLNDDGSLDQTFQPASLPEGDINDIAVESTGTILIGGAFSELNGQSAQGLVRLSQQGQLIQSFSIASQGNALVSELISQPDGRFFVSGTRSGEGFVSYRQPDGQEVPGFSFSSNLPEPNNFMTSVRDIALDPQGRIVLTASTFLIRYAVVVLNLDGSLLSADSFIGVPTDLAVNANGDMLVTGEFENVNAVHRYLPGQGLDIYALGNGADGLIRSLAVQPSGQLLLGGRFSAFNSQTALGVEQLSASGQASSNFDSALERPGIVRSIVRYDADRVCIGGDFARVGNRTLTNVARIRLDDGSPDPNFQHASLYYRNQVNHISVDSQGRIWVAGTNNSDGQSLLESPIVRLSPNGALDLSFNPSVLPVGTIRRLHTLGNGQTLAMGSFAIFNNGLLALDVAVYDNNGSVDEAFSDRFSGKVTDCISSSDGSLYLAGNAIRYDNSSASTVLRLTPDFELDGSFNAPSGLVCRGSCQIRLSELESGQLLVGGPVLLGSDTSLVRLQANGHADAGFTLGATFYQEEEWIAAAPTALQPLPDGDLLVTGPFTSLGDTPLRGMIRLSPDGSLQDPLTQNDFAQQQLQDALLLSGERVLLSGDISNTDGDVPPLALAIADLTNTPVEPPGISGYIRSWQDEPMGQVEVALSGSQTFTTVTDSLGFYQFEQLQAGGSYTVTPMYDIEHPNGLSIMDLIMINKHILGVETITSPYQLLASDTNNSGSITVTDLINIQRLILGINNRFSSHTSWRFIPAGFIFSTPASPWQNLPPAVSEVNGLPAEGLENLDFISIKIGDPSGSAQVP